MPKVSNTDKPSHIRMKKTVKILDTPELSVNTADLAFTAGTLALTCILSKNTLQTVRRSDRSKSLM